MALREHFELNRDREVWIKHYSSNHQILLVGSPYHAEPQCSLATLCGSTSNICASSVDSYGSLPFKAKSNLDNLKRLGASLLYGIDATKLKQDPHLNCRRFDRVIFNFPHAGFHGEESDSYLMKHRGLVFGFFLRANGEIHLAHKNKAPFSQWNLEELASKCFLVLIQCVAFKKKN
ncbi:unnamed protein product [Brassica oleracea]